MLQKKIYDRKFARAEKKAARSRAWELAQRTKPVAPDPAVFEYCRALRRAEQRCA